MGHEVRPGDQGGDRCSASGGGCRPGRRLATPCTALGQRAHHAVRTRGAPGVGVGGGQESRNWPRREDGDGHASRHRRLRRGFADARAQHHKGQASRRRLVSRAEAARGRAVQGPPAAAHRPRQGGGQGRKLRLGLPGGQGPLREGGAGCPLPRAGEAVPVRGSRFVVSRGTLPLHRRRSSCMRGGARARAQGLVCGAPTATRVLTGKILTRERPGSWPLADKCSGSVF
mmetsp:Transcript_26857/g.78213  ORF Transcript_26857/g.78213 Transcript_26857/m.78213 type:complete len:229 (+) Transcript_26857:2114-2800(+)